MLVLAIDTCDANGSVAVLRDGLVGGTTTHPADADYSSWLLPTVDVLLAAADARLRDVELFAVATGPGSFTGVRIGLTTVKAWSEVFGRPIAAMSRLEVLAAQARSHAPFVATFIDALRGQVFGALYKRNGPDLVLCTDEAVIGTSDFIGQVLEEAGSSQVEWVSTDSFVMGQQDGWQERAAQGERILEVAPMLAPLIGELGVQKASKGELQDAVSLDANYVRRSYVECLSKPPNESRTR
jgi:tRNA threonylcarbamoyladenosine biosynthesis protein TsaB